MNASSRHTVTSAQAVFGMVLLGAGLAVIGLAAWDNSDALPFAMPRFWRSQQTLCLILAFLSVAGGLFVISHGPRVSDRNRYASRWKPSRPGRRFQQVVVYSRQQCPLCDEAVELLNHYSAYLPSIHEADIDADQRLRERFDHWVPVVEIDGKVRFKGRVSEVLLRRLIEGTPPA